MDCEVEFHPVGDASRAGDAISVRYGANGNYRVIVIDGGTDNAGAALVEHIAAHYGSNTVIEHVINSHPDTDHACGLRKILEAYKVENLWLHGVWHHSKELLPYFADKRWTEDSLATAIRKEYSVVEELIDLADAQGTVIREPFQGAVIGPFTVLSPSRYAYLRLVPQFRKTPDCDTVALAADKMLLGSRSSTLAGFFGKLAAGLAAWVDEEWNFETLREGALTAAENETSTVLYGDFGPNKVLLTGDAGVNGLSWSCDYADQLNLALDGLNLVQVPHHGSRSNVTPSILDRLIGTILPQGSPARRTAVVSAPKDDSSHPRKIVLNAFHRRGAPVYATQGNYVRWHSGTMPVRSNERSIMPFDLFGRVEDYD